MVKVTSPRHHGAELAHSSLPPRTTPPLPHATTARPPPYTSTAFVSNTAATLPRHASSPASTTCRLRPSAFVPAAFLASPAGLTFVHRLCTAAHLVFCLQGPCGLRLLSAFLRRAGLDRVV